MASNDIGAKLNDIELFECWEAFKNLDPRDRISMDHIDLAEYSDVHNIESWKRFLSHPVIKDFIDEELRIFTAAQQRKLISTAVDNDRSTGAAQMISALGKANEDTNAATSGEIFVYSYCPLTEKEEMAPNVRKEQTDPFKQ